MHKLISNAKDNDDWIFGFDRGRDRRQRELTNNKNVKGKYHVRIMLKNLFGFAEHRKKGTYRLGCKLTIIRYSDSSVLKKAIATNNAKLLVLIGMYHKTLHRFRNKLFYLNMF